MHGSRVGLWIEESLATLGLYCVIIALTRNLKIILPLVSILIITIILF